jgi:GT2 family glycosyltransferase
MSAPETQADPYTISIVVEWENALNAEADRTFEMLRQVTSQARKHASRHAGERFEVLVVFDDELFQAAALQDFVESAIGRSREILDVRFLKLPGGGYYASKDHGVRAARGERVLLVDSDVVPEDGWLDTLLKALNNDGVNLVAGSTYIDAGNFIGKTFALNWFFPLRSEASHVETTSRFFANNLAIRRSFYLQHPFPDVAGTSRGSCVVLSHRLSEQGLSIHRANDARSSHPAPNGFRHLVPRALAQGRDQVLCQRFLGHRLWQSWPASFVRLAGHMVRSFVRTLAGRNRVGLGILQVPAAIAVAWVYYLLFWAGETGEHLGLRAVRNIRV